MKTINIDDVMPRMQFSFEGREYTLRCNMCVYDAVLNECGGDLSLMLKNPAKSVSIWLAAMMNDFAEDQDWPDYVPYTSKKLRKKLPADQNLAKEVMSIVARSLTATKPEDPAPAVDPVEGQSSD